jgi:hypothetical protein
LLIMHPARRVKVGPTNSGDEQTRPGTTRHRVTEPEAEPVRQCHRSRVARQDYKLFRVASFTSFMTVSTPFSMNRHLHPSNTSPTDRFRSLDRALAAKYVQLVIAHRRRVAAARSHGGEIMRPRCVPSFLSLRCPLTFLPAWKYAMNLNPASSVLHLSCQASRKRR